MAYISRLIPILLFLSVSDCWRPMIRRDPLRDPTYEYTPPVTLQYWNEEPPSASLVPPPPGPPLPWLTSQQSSSDYTQAVYSYSTETVSTSPTTYTMTTTSTTTTTAKPITVTTTRSTAAPPAMVIEGHSKVKKYGPVEGSVNSVFVHSGKN